MSSKRQKRAALYEKLQLLRAATNSSAFYHEKDRTLQKRARTESKQVLSVLDIEIPFVIKKMNKTSIIVDASKYIGDLKEKVERLNQETGTSQAATAQNSLPVVTVETLEKGFLINVFSEKNCPGLLVSILEAFEELGLDVLDARVSCSDNFQLEAVGGENQGHANSIDAQVVKQAVLQAINNWSESSEQ